MPISQKVLLSSSISSKVFKKAVSSSAYYGIFIALLGIAFTSSITNPVYSVPGSNCFEQISCATTTLINQPWTTAKSYFDTFFTIAGNSYTITIFWGVLIAVLWLRTQSPMLVMIVGIIVSTTAIGLNQLAVGIGLMLCSVAIGIILFQVIRQRTSVLSF